MSGYLNVRCCNTEAWSLCWSSPNPPDKHRWVLKSKSTQNSSARRMVGAIWDFWGIGVASKENFPLLLQSFYEKNHSTFNLSIVNLYFFHAACLFTAPLNMPEFLNLSIFHPCLQGWSGPMVPKWSNGSQKAFPPVSHTQKQYPGLSGRYISLFSGVQASRQTGSRAVVTQAGDPYFEGTRQLKF